MITNLKVTSLKSVPHLATSQLMQLHQFRLDFSQDKPVVIVGPNGVGKSALLTALALRTLTYFTGTSELDRHYLGTGRDEFWHRARTWGNDYEFLSGLSVSTDNAPALYFRPGHIPGNDESVTASMMCGYGAQAKAYGMLTRNRSSGQQGQALLAHLLAVLRGKQTIDGYGVSNEWRYGLTPKAPDASYGSNPMPWDYQANKLLELIAIPAGTTPKPLVLMDEPEQSLDALAELDLWNAIEHTDCEKLQVIVATHSLYPFLHPEKFHIIEGVAGYSAIVRKALGL